MTEAQMSGSRVALLVAALAVLAALVAAPLPAFAHNSLVSSTPAEGETLTAPPEKFSITTSGELLDLGGEGEGFALQVRDAAGVYYGDGCVAVADSSVSTDAALGEPGEYQLIWQALGEDGHSISGEIGFTWSPTDAVAASEGSPTPPLCGEQVDGDAAGDPSGVSAVDAWPAVWIGGATLALVAVVAALLYAASRRRES